MKWKTIYKNIFARSRKSSAVTCTARDVGMYLLFPSLKLLSFHRSSQGALQGGGTSSHSYSSSSYCHGQSGDKAGKKHLPKRIQTYGFHILCFIPFPVLTNLVLWLPHLQLQQGLNHSQSKLFISKWFGSSSRDRLSSFPMPLLTNGYLNSGWVWNVSAAKTLGFPIGAMVSPFFPQGSQECAKIPPTRWASLIQSVPWEQPGPQRGNAKPTCAVTHPTHRLLSKCYSWSQK